MKVATKNIFDSGVECNAGAIGRSC